VSFAKLWSRCLGAAVGVADVRRTCVGGFGWRGLKLAALGAAALARGCAGSLSVSHSQLLLAEMAAIITRSSSVPSSPAQLTAKSFEALSKSGQGQSWRPFTVATHYWWGSGVNSLEL